jgi:hypothetical protein
MTTISTVCVNLFSQTNLKDLPRIPDRGTRRNLARVVYRTARRPGLVNPGESPGPLSPHERTGKSRVSRTARPMRHVYKFHEPPLPKPGSLAARLRLEMVPRLSRLHRKTKP